MRAAGSRHPDTNRRRVGRWGHGPWSSCNFNGDGELTAAAVMAVKCAENIPRGLFVLYHPLHVSSLFWEQCYGFTSAPWIHLGFPHLASMPRSPRMLSFFRFLPGTDRICDLADWELGDCWQSAAGPGLRRHCNIWVWTRGFETEEVIVHVIQFRGL